MAILEIACFNAESAAIACDAGADRIELCDDYEAGGITPSRASARATVAIARKKGIPVFVMIRPRGGNFVYSETDFDQIMTSLLEMRRLGVDGFVFGLLSSDGTVDVVRTRMLVEAACPLPCTFHRAFDETPDVLTALEDVYKTGCAAILSSGGKATAVSGSHILAKLVERAGDKLSIIPGGGVRSGNIAELHSKTKAKAFHTSALLHGFGHVDTDEILGMKARLSL